MKCDKLTLYHSKSLNLPIYVASEVDAAIAELKDKLHDVDNQWNEQCKEIAELKDKCQMHDFFWEGCGFVKRGFKNTIAVSEAFDKLEAENAELKAMAEEREKEIEFMHSNCKWSAGDGCDRLHGELMAAVGDVGELKAEIESLKAGHYVEMVDAGMRERRLHRALWLARALRARDIQRWWLSATLAPITERACRVWNNIEIKCLKKAEAYK